jgi:F-type H+-transporting ATPase subunit b
MYALFSDTYFVVLVAFVVFAGLLAYVRVDKLLFATLDQRAAKIKAELEEARRLREEAQRLLSTFERKQGEVGAQTAAIIAQAEEDAKLAAAQAKADLAASMERRIRAAEEQIASAEKAAIKEVKDRAVTIAVAAAREVIAARLPAEARADMVDAAISEVGAKLH